MDLKLEKALKVSALESRYSEALKCLDVADVTNWKKAVETCHRFSDGVLAFGKAVVVDANRISERYKLATQHVELINKLRQVTDRVSISGILIESVEDVKNRAYEAGYHAASYDFIRPSETEVSELKTLFELSDRLDLAADHLQERLLTFINKLQQAVQTEELRRSGRGRVVLKV